MRGSWASLSTETFLNHSPWVSVKWWKQWHRGLFKKWKSSFKDKVEFFSETFFFFFCPCLKFRGCPCVIATRSGAAGVLRIEDSRSIKRLSPSCCLFLFFFCTSLCFCGVFIMSYLGSACFVSQGIQFPVSKDKEWHPVINVDEHTRRKERHKDCLQPWPFPYKDWQNDDLNCENLAEVAP